MTAIQQTSPLVKSTKMMSTRDGREIPVATNVSNADYIKEYKPVMIETLQDSIKFGICRKDLFSQYNVYWQYEAPLLGTTGTGHYNKPEYYPFGEEYGDESGMTKNFSAPTCCFLA